MAEINLLQNRLKDTTNAWEKQGRLIIGILSAILILLIAAGLVLFFFNKNLQTQSASLTSENQDLQNKLTGEQSNLGDAKVFQAQLVNLHTLINSHTFMSPFFDELSKVTYIKAQYDTIDINESGKVHVEGKVPSYSDLGKLLLGLSTSTQFKNVQLLSVLPSAGANNAYEFSVDFTVPSYIFTKK